VGSALDTANPGASANAKDSTETSYPTAQNVPYVCNDGSTDAEKEQIVQQVIRQLYDVLNATEGVEKLPATAFLDPTSPSPAVTEASVWKD